MENKQFKIQRSKFKLYIKTLLEFDNLFDNYIKKANDGKIIKDNGYLIEKRSFDTFKEILNYTLFRTYINDDSKFNKKMNEIFENDKDIIFIPCEQKIFITSKEFMDNLKNNEYVIINILVWKIINNKKYKENEGKINYQIKDKQIMITFEPGETAYFTRSFNIIKFKNLLSRASENFVISEKVQNHKDNTDGGPMKLNINLNNTNNNSQKNLINELYLSLIEYYNFEKLLMNKLKSNDNDNNGIIEGYFVEKNWFQKWKLYTDNDNNRFLLIEKNEQNIEKILNSIKINSKPDIKPITIKFFNKNHLDSIFKNEIFILVSEQFIKYFEVDIEKQKRYKISFKIKNHKFYFSDDNKEKFSIYALNNILPIEANECFKITNNLVELYIFQEQLKIQITQGKKINNENLILVDSKWLNNYKNKYLYSQLYNFIKELPIIKNRINNLEKNNENYKLNNIIMNFNWQYFFDIYNINIQDIGDNYYLWNVEIKTEDNIKNIKYLDNFELLDINIFNKLNIKEETKNKISKKIIEYYLDTNKLLIKYENPDNRDIYIIGYISNNNLFISEYLIEPIIPPELKYYLIQNKINDIIKGRNNYIMNVHNKIIGNIYKINIGIAYKIEEDSLSSEMIEEIYIIIKIYLFNLDLKKIFDSSMAHAGSENYKNYIKTDKCYLINKEWMDEFKKYYLYDELYNYLEKDEIKKKIKIHHYNGKSYNESEKNVEAIFNEIKSKADFFKNYYNKSPKLIDSKLLDIKPMNSGNKNNKNEYIYYYDNFVMIDMELKRAIIIKKYKKSIGDVEYIINMGKIIILLNYHPMNLLLIGSINFTKGECNFIPISFIYFDDANELQKNYKILKSCDINLVLNQINKNKGKIFDKNHLKEVGALYSLDDKEDIKENKDKKKDNIIKYIVELYLAMDNLYFHIKDKSKALLSQEGYYLINKIWLEYLNECYNFDQINNEIKNNSLIKGIIEKNRELLEKASESNIINSIINQIPEEIKNDINNKEKAYDKFLLNSFEQKLNNEEIYYYDDCILINEKIKNILENINHINEKFNVDVNCFIASKQIFTLYRLKNKPLICIGKLDENNILKNNIIITSDSNDTFENYILKIIAKGEVQELLNKIKQENKKDKYHINNLGWVFLLDSLNKEKNNPEKNINDQNINDVGVENIGQLTIPVGVNSNIIKNDIDEIKKISNQDNILGQNRNIENNANVNEKIKLLLKEQMKPIINYYLFNRRIINELELSKTDKNGIFYNNFKHYLINSKSIGVFKTHYLINALFSFFRNKFEKPFNNLLNNDSTDAIIKELLSEKMLGELSQNIIYKNLINNLKTELKIEENNFNFEYDIINNKYYLKNFEIIDENFYKEIIIKKNMNYKNKIFATDIIINNGKIVVDLKEYVLIGHLKDITTYNYSFVSDALLIDYKNKNNNIIIGSLKQMS